MIGIIGATGTVGGALARLLADDDMPFRALVRGGTTTVPGAEVVLADLDEPATLTGALAGIDQLFLLTAGTGPQVVQQEAVIDAAVAAGVDHVVKVSTVGAHPGGPLVLGDHARIEDHLANSGLAATVLRPNSYFQNLLTTASFTATGDLLDLFGGGAVAHIDAEDVAASAHAVLTGIGATGGVKELTGPRALRPEELASALSKVVGRHVGVVSPEGDELEQMMLGRGAPPSSAREVVDLRGVVAAGALSHATSEVAELTGRPPRSVEAFLARRRDELRRVVPAGGSR